MTSPFARGVGGSPPASSLLRACVLVAALSAVAALVASGLMTAALGVPLALLAATCAAGPVLLTSAAGVTARKVASLAVICVALGGALVLDRPVDAGGAVADLPGQMGPRLAVFAVGLLIAQLLVGDRLREVLVSLLAAAGLLIFAVAAEPGPLAGLALAAGWPAVVTALAVAREARRREAADARVVVDGGERAPVAASAVVVLAVGSAVVGLLVVLLGPQPEGLQPRRDGGFSRAGGSTAGGSASREVSAYTHGTLDLRARGTLPDTEIAEVPADSPRLWLGATLTVYDGTTWRSPNSGLIVGPPLPGGPPYELPADPWDPVTPTRADRLEPREGFRGVVLTPGHPLTLDVESAVVPIGGGYLLGRSLGTGGYPTSYVVGSTSTSPPASVLRAAVPHPATGPTGPDDFTALPPTVPARVLELGRRLTAGVATRYDATVAVERYLHRHATYRLDSPVPPPGTDAVDHFLFSARTGFCEQFATAEVVLLRAAGIPARLATGFTGGEPDGDHRTLRGSDAHAWVEVLYPGVGWAASDPTAGARLAEGSSLRDRLRELMSDAKGRALIAALVVGATLLGAGLAWATVRLVGAGRRRRSDRSVLRELPPILAAFHRLERALARTGAPRSGSESIGELGARPDLAPVAGALAVVEQACYSAYPPTEEVTAAAVRALDDHAEHLSQASAQPSQGSDWSLAKS